MGKRFKNGLVLGKFMPPHNGHVHLINSAADQCDHVHVLVCSTTKDPIPGDYRRYWLRHIFQYNDNISVKWIHEDLPQVPEDCGSVDEFYDIWVKKVYENVESLDAVFTSEEYGDEFAKYLKVEHVLVDLERKKFPVSGTAVREDPFKHWYYLPEIVRPHFLKKVAILGPESTGKSTLAKALALLFDTCHVEEYGREYTKLRSPKDLTPDDFDVIALEHSFAIDRAEKKANMLLFSDTEAIITKVFAEEYIKGFKSNFIDDLIEREKKIFDLFILLDIDVPWVDDGTREFPHKREEFFNKIKAELQAREIPFVIIGGDYQERIDKAREEVSKLLQVSEK